jgi:hypothetical protein
MPKTSKVKATPVTLFQRAQKTYTKENPQDRGFFTWFNLTFNLSKAEMILKQRGDLGGNNTLSVKKLAKTFGFSGVAEEEAMNAGKTDHASVCLIGIDPKRASELPTDALDSPILLATFRMPDDNDPDGKLDHMVIDGWHRCYRAWLEGWDEVKCNVLTEPETYAIMEELPVWELSKEKP